MSEDQLDHDVLSRVGIDRRSFIKKVIIGTAFTVPLVASFDMLVNSQAGGVTCTTANSTSSGSGGSGGGGSGTFGGDGGTRRKNKGPGGCGGTPNGGEGGGVTLKSDRVAKTDIVPVVWTRG